MKRILAALLLLSVASVANAAPRMQPGIYGWGFAGAPVVIVNQTPPPPRPVIIQAPPKPLTRIEREQLQGVYRGTGKAEAPYGGGPKTTYNPFCNQK